MLTSLRLLRSLRVVLSSLRLLRSLVLRLPKAVGKIGGGLTLWLSLRRLMLRLPKAVRKIGGGLMGLGGLVAQALIVTGGTKASFSTCVACVDWGAMPRH